MITLFTTCKSFEGVTHVHQCNALLSWMTHELDILVFGDERIADTCHVLGLDCVLNTPHDEWGLPLLNSMFASAQVSTRHEFLCYANADIIVADGLIDAAWRLGDKFPNFLGVCRRWDVNLDEPLLLEDWWAVVHQRIQDGGELYTPCSSDLFLFRKPLPWDLPPFAAGRPKWDNWMMWASCEHETPVVDMTEAVTVAHPRHGYGADGRIGQKTWRKHPGGQRNEQLAAGKTFCLKHVQRAGWLWKLTGDGEVVKI